MSLFLKVRYYTGQASAGRDYTASIDEHGWLILPESGGPATHISDIDISPRVGNSMRYLTLPDGSSIETADNDIVDQAVKDWKIPNSAGVHFLEHSTKYALAALAALVFSVTLFVTVGVPALSAVIVAMLPDSLDNRLGGEVLEQLDELVFTESALEPDRQQELRVLFNALVPDNERDYLLEFRSSELLGANAIALPDAHIVLTDQLVELADNDAMISGILLHEIGHVVGRHSMQAVVRQAGISMLIVALAGDVNTAATALLVMLPSVLIQSEYSRNMEWSADTYALEQMQLRGLDTGLFADMMDRVASAEGVDRAMEDGTEAAGEGEGILDYFSSHPATRERIQRFREASR